MMIFLTAESLFYFPREDFQVNYFMHAA